MDGPRRRVTLLTDFGTADGYVAAVRGVIASIAPDAVVEDATHDIAPGDVQAAAWVLSRYWRLFPEGTVHLAVVDPGVGGTRRALAGEAAGHCFVAPDNGLLTRVLAAAPSARLFTIENPEYMGHQVSATFHGRDVFAPAAAHLVNGVALDELGTAVSDPLRLVLPTAARVGDQVQGMVIHVDVFGNLITNIPADWVGRRSEILVEDKPVGRLRSSYSEVGSGDRLALIGSADLLEIAVRDGSAATVLGTGRGAQVVARDAARD